MWPMILLPVLEVAVSLLFASIICSYSSFFTTNPSVVVIAWGARIGFVYQSVFD